MALQGDSLDLTAVEDIIYEDGQELSYAASMECRFSISEECSY